MLAVCDGQRAVALAPAQDFKRVARRRRRARTPAAWARTRRCRSPATAWSTRCMDRFVEPDARRAPQPRHRLPRRALRRARCSRPTGPKLLEYNVRFGDPEAQVVLPRLTSDLAELLAAAADGDSASAPTRRSTTAPPSASSCATPGLPASAAHRRRDRGPRRRPPRSTGVTVFCAGVGARRRRPPGHRRRPGARRRRPRRRPCPTPGSGPTPPSRASRGPACTTAPTSRPARRAAASHEGRRPDGVAQRPGEDAAGRRHARAVRHRGRRAGAVGPPHARGGRRARASAPGTTATARSSAAPAWPRTSPARSPPTPRCRSSACRCPAARSTASTRCTPPCRCRRASRWPPSPSTAP